MAFVTEADHLLVDELKAVLNRKVLRDVVDNQVKSFLENPRRSEEARPGLHCVVEGFGLRRHEKAGVSSDLAKFGCAHLSLDDGVDKAEGKWVLLHLHFVEVVEGKLRNALNCDREFTAEVSLLCFKVNFLVNEGC